MLRDIQQITGSAGTQPSTGRNCRALVRELEARAHLQGARGEVAGSDRCAAEAVQPAAQSGWRSPLAELLWDVVRRSSKKVKQAMHEHCVLDFIAAHNPILGASSLEHVVCGAGHLQ